MRKKKQNDKRRKINFLFRFIKSITFTSFSFLACRNIHVKKLDSSFFVQQPSEERKKSLKFQRVKFIVQKQEEEESTEILLGKQKRKVHITMHTRNGICSNLTTIMNFYVVIVGIIAIVQNAHASPNKDVQPAVRINKCCERFEILVDSRCTNAASLNMSE